MKIIIDNKIPFIKEAVQRIADEVVYVPGKDFTPELIRDADALIVENPENMLAVSLLESIPEFSSDDAEFILEVVDQYLVLQTGRYRMDKCSGMQFCFCRPIYTVIASGVEILQKQKVKRTDDWNHRSGKRRE